ncbi:MULTISPECIES: hypothetical protein [Streptomyces]|uniref:hypothetical protein n=1 Tax=Streptomyces TaxID=1883 RepID=UPI00068B8DCF|nr:MULTISPECIES: hypothetical protein [unclassified Streptomyces]QHF97156.1 hypothetical protein DEH18_28655 [Streptomyces sp. NHF165]
MVNSPHEAHHRAFQELPGLFASAFRLLGLPAPGRARVDVLNCDLTEIRPVERRVDTLLRLSCADTTYLLIVEAQTRKDPDKALSWGYYLGFLANKYPRERPVLLVVCRDSRTARWAAGPFRIGHPDQPNMHITPFVLGPDNVPVITDIERASADLPLAVFSALTHSDDPRIGEILDVLATALKTSDNPERVTVCADITASGLADSPAGELWRELMAAGLFELRGFVAEGLREEGREKGREEGREEGLAAGLEQGLEKGLGRGRFEGRLMCLFQLCEARGITLSEEQRARISACKDSGLITRWFHRAATVETAEEMLAGEGVPARPDDTVR